MNVQGCIYLSTARSVERAGCMPTYQKQCSRGGCFFFHLRTIFYDGTPDCPASDNTGAGMRNADAETGTGTKGTQFGTGMLRYRNELLNDDAEDADACPAMTIANAQGLSPIQTVKGYLAGKTRAGARSHSFNTETVPFSKEIVFL